MRYFLVLGAALSLSGCAHVLEIVDNQSIETSRMGKKDKSDDARIITIDGPRRLVRSTYQDGRWKLCAETQADAIAARTSTSSFDVTGQGALNDTIAEALTTTYTRTELSDNIRQLAWHVCNSEANGTFTPQDAKDALSILISGTMLVHQLRADADVAALAKARADLATAKAKLDAISACVVKADGDKAKFILCKEAVPT